jgi:peptidoglycan/xylan/chitin deacetylase (PgdA/CDA1 family)
MRRYFALFLLSALLCSFPLSVRAETSDVVGDHMEMIALTFDDGPHPGNTGRVLDVLKKYGVHATFFVLGCNAGYYPEPLRRAIAEGHEIENHSFDHKTKNKRARELADEIEKTGALIGELSGRRPQYFRPPEGKCPPALSEALETLGYEAVFWTIDSEDWRGKSPEQIFESVLSSVRGNDVILFHDYTCPNGNTVMALDLLIPELIHRGYRFVTVEELKNKTASVK